MTIDPRALLAAAAAAAVLTACVPAGGGGPGPQPGMPVPSGNLLGGDQIAPFVSGNTLSGDSGGAFAEYHAPDGTVYGRWTDTGTAYTARWFVQGDTLCYDYPATAQDGCWTVRASTDPAYLTNQVVLTNVATGRALSPLTLRPGNPLNLGGYDGGGIYPGANASNLVGKTVSGTTDGAEWHEYHAPGGLLSGWNARQGDYSARYTVQGNQVCYDYPGSAQDGCWTVQFSGDQVYATNTRTGQSLGPLRLQQGNPYQF